MGTNINVQITDENWSRLLGEVYRRRQQGKPQAEHTQRAIVNEALRLLFEKLDQEAKAAGKAAKMGGGA